MSSTTPEPGVHSRWAVFFPVDALAVPLSGAPYSPTLHAALVLDTAEAIARSEAVGALYAVCTDPPLALALGSLSEKVNVIAELPTEPLADGMPTAIVRQVMPALDPLDLTPTLHGATADPRGYVLNAEGSAVVLTTSLQAGAIDHEYRESLRDARGEGSVALDADATVRLGVHAISQLVAMQDLPTLGTRMREALSARQIVIDDRTSDRTNLPDPPPSPM